MSEIRQPQNCIYVTDFSEEGVKEFKADFDRLKGSNFPIIPVYIDSLGGEVYSLLAMIDILASSEIPVATIALGKAMSCGSVLLACGTPGLRFIGKHGTVMIHDCAKFSVGKLEELKADVSEAERLNKLIFKMLDERCKKKDGYFQHIIGQKKHVDWFLGAQEVLEHGIVDHIGLPTLDSQFTIDILNKELNAAAAAKTAKEKPAKGKKARKNKGK